MTSIEKVVKAYFPARSVSETEVLSGGLINQTILVSLDNAESFILQIINTEVFVNVSSIHRNVELVAEHLENKEFQYAFPVPFFSESGDTIHWADNEAWRMLPFVDGSYSIETCTSELMAYNAGKCLGQFHACTQGLKPQQLAVTIPEFHSGKLRVEQFENAIDASKFDDIGLVEKISGHLNVLLEWDDICSRTPERVIHYDTKIENFLFRKGTEEVAAIIDLDTIMPGCRLSDIGDMIRSFCDTKTGFNLQLREAAIEGYLSEMNPHMMDLEKEKLHFSGEALTLMQALRFLTDHLNGNTYYKVEHQGQNLERAHRQFQLYQHLNS